MTSPLTIPVAVDIVALTVIDHTLHALVVRRGLEPFKDHLALPGVDDTAFVLDPPLRRPPAPAPASSMKSASAPSAQE